MSKSLATARQSTLVKLVLEDGTEGYGEAWGIPAVNLAYLPFLQGYVVGATVFDIEHVFSRILARHYHFGVQGPFMACLSGIDIAAKDATGKLLGLPVHRLIGGKRWDRVSVYASGGYITEDPDRDFEPQIARMAKDGHRAIKIKIGLSPASDAARVALARRIMGDDADIMVDINSNYTVDLARESISRIAQHRIGWVEEPLAPQDISGYEQLQRWSPIPIATGEALYTAHDFKLLVDRRGVDVMQPDLSLCGGFWQGRAIASMAVLNHVRISPHVWGTGIGLAAGVHYVAAMPSNPHADNIPKPPLVEYDVGVNPLRESLLRAPLRPVDGMIAVPDAPGLGIEIDWDAVGRYAVR
nr:mandelate racemase/muconate lactonizing enzyme family protein [Limobrevibacterium gyesilva]